MVRGTKIGSDHNLTSHSTRKDCYSILSSNKQLREFKLFVSNQLFTRYLTDFHKTQSWFAFDTLFVLWLIAEFQYTHLPIVNGAIGEIGVHRGKFTSYLYLLRHRSGNQTLFAVDVFAKKSLNIDQSGNGDRNEFLKAIKTYANVSVDEVDIYEGNSLDLNSAYSNNTSAQYWWQKKVGKNGFQIVSIDGGHTTLLTYADLCSVSRFLVDGGIVIVDDIDNPGWLGVRDGVGRFLSETSSLFNINDDSILFNMLKRHTFAPTLEFSCRIVEVTSKAGQSEHGCSRLVPILHYANKLYLTTSNYYPHYMNFLAKLNANGVNVVTYDALKSVAGNVPIWSDSQSNQRGIPNNNIRPTWLAEITRATG
ncbi:unnamed protein product [Adineta ricciae]|uniref:Uncharacterized protein n=1 Tax=Adineta ricciae TaxID=249248 RepID=A0A815E7T6_ADIRI|nr:unnamed protein product [Adineta ricciae]CAF1307791.1 unnamed protein product [Adineta ricciae]